MYNTDNQIQSFETLPGESKANVSPEKAQELAENAAAWENAMSDYNAASESVDQAIETGDDAMLAEAQQAQQQAQEAVEAANAEQAADIKDIQSVSPDNNMTPRLNSPSNPVAHAFDQAWRDGKGGVALEDAYDGIRAQNSAESLQVAAEQIEPEVAVITRENSNTGNATIEASEDGVTEEAAEQQNLEEIAEAATAVAIGAKAETEQAVQDLNHNRTEGATSAEASLAEAQAQLSQLQSEAHMSQNEQPGEIQAQRTSENIISEAIDMVDNAANDLEQATDRQEERQEEAEEKKEEIRRFEEEQAEIAAAEQQQVESLQEAENSLPANNQLSPEEASDYAKGDIFNTHTDDTENNPEYIDDNNAEQEDEYETPRQSIFG
ncbi:MAG: hypothetical protein Q4A96_02665 [Candidatus Saccharibacteria bacterium]|nr:hypothetical protein [Candidatus Saccharibacteria bacterium]